MNKVKKVIIMIVLVLSAYMSVGALFPQLRSRENPIVMNYIK